LELGIPY
jgi:hypothetical protein